MSLFNMPPVWMATMGGEAVSATGRLGQLGAAYLTPARIGEVVADIRARAAQPFGIKFVCAQL